MSPTLIKRGINLKFAKKAVVGSILAILALTIMELPAPIGFETRPQNNVSMFWLMIFLAILVTEISTMPLIYKRAKLGVKFAYTAAGLNIFQIIADQLHLMQPEVASIGYSMLEYAVGAAAIVLIYFARVVDSDKTAPNA